MCISGAILFNGQCRTSCPEGYFASLQGNNAYQCLACDSKCQSCNGSSEYDCTSCQETYYFLDGMCLSECPEGMFPNSEENRCQKCPIGCTSCTSLTKCSTCDATYTLSSTFQCNPSVPVDCNLTSCSVCSSSNNSQCIQCISGYYLHNHLCLVSCPQGYFPIEGFCASCSANCSQCSQSGCSVCLTGYYLYSGMCYSQCPPSTIANPVSLICETDPCLHYNGSYP